MKNSKTKTAFFCTECGNESPTWKGQCPACGAWDCMKEEPVSKSKSTSTPTRKASWTGQTSRMQNLNEVNTGETAQRYSSGISEFDRALGGGLVEGGVVLLGGDPGIGKSTLLLQTLALCQDVPRLYVTGEESPGQVANRGKRLNLNMDGVSILAETQLEAIIENAYEKFKGGRGLLVADSIQTIYSEEISSAPGTVTQVRECAARLTRLAKETGLTVILIGHVTKDGSLAGPRVLEHLVDTVLYFEGDTQSSHRLIRAFKNRFGAAQELGAFEMTEMGLISVDNPSSMFLNHDRSQAAGSCVFAHQEGTRPLLLEIQALMDDMQGGQPRRLAVGIDQNRLSMILAVLHKHGSLMVSDQDVFVNVVGGLRIQETALDLPVVLSLISSLRERALPADLMCFGEIGLTGELRPVQKAEERLKEGARLGFASAIVPIRNLPNKPIQGLEVIGVKNLSEAIEALASFEQPGFAKSKNTHFNPNKTKKPYKKRGADIDDHSEND